MKLRMITILKFRVFIVDPCSCATQGGRGAGVIYLFIVREISPAAADTFFLKKKNIFDSDPIRLIN